MVFVGCIGLTHKHATNPEAAALVVCDKRLQFVPGLHSSPYSM